MGKRRIWALKCTETGTQTPHGEMKGWNPGLREPLRWIAGSMCFTNKECHKQTDKQQCVMALEEKKSGPMQQISPQHQRQRAKE